MITNENDFLGLIISCADESYNCEAVDVVEKSGMSDIDCLPFIKSLESKNLIRMTSTTTIHIYPQAYGTYVSPAKNVKRSFIKTSKFTFKTLLGIIVSIICGVAIAYIVYYFGWN